MPQNPAIFYDNNGNIYLEVYRDTKRRNHRVDGPAVIQYYSSGSKFGERYFINGKLHRIDGPASILYNQDGNISVEEYYIDGVRHNSIKPAIIYYSRINPEIITYSQFYLNGEYLESNLINKAGYIIMNCKRCNINYLTKNSTYQL